jgi:osmoprotectant transport system substrate-binding protein/osmoprotectant transport system permease protein
VTWENIVRQLDLLPEYMGNHLMLTLVSLCIGIVICIPLAVAVSRVKQLQWPTLAVASVLQTIPGIAMLALMVPLLGQIGFLPALIALVLYSMLPMVRNTLTGILGVDPAITEAARGMGMTPMQMLFRVEIPLAGPVIIAGIRTATVWVVGTATLSTPVGATSLGNYIFSGLQTQNAAAVIVGCVAAAVLAIILDQLIRLMELAASRRSRTLATTAAVGLLVIIGGGMTPLLMQSHGHAARPSVVVGAKTFTEQYILAELLTTTLRESGFSASAKTGMGSTVLSDALASGNIDCYVDYSGTIWANIMKRDDILPRHDLLRELTGWLKTEYGIVVLGPLGFENTYALAMSGRRAQELGIRSMADLSSAAPGLRIGSDYEFFARPEWRALAGTYRLNFAEQRSFDPTLMYAAIAEGAVDVISAYSTDGRIASHHLLVLEDPKQALPPYDAVLLLSRNAGSRSDLVSALTPIVGSITDSLMRQANKLVDVDGESVGKAASFLRKKINGPSYP